MSRLVLILLMAGSLIAAASFDLFHVSPEQEHENLVEWHRLNESERDVLRQTWRSLAVLKGAQGETIRQRLATVARVLQRARARTGQKISREQLVSLLEEYPTHLQRLLDRHGIPSGGLRERLHKRTRRLVLAFLKGLTELGRLDITERQGLEDLPYPSLIAEALDLQKREEIFLYAEGAPPLQPVDVLSLQDLTPLDVAEKMREMRRRRGLMGKASRHFGLTEADRSWLAEVSDEDLVSGLRSVYEPKVRRHLERKGWSEGKIGRFLSQPFRVLERTLNRLEREGL